MSQRSNQTRSPRSRAKSVHDELVRTADLILRAGEEFTEAVTDAANEAARYKARVSELEAMNRDFAAEIARFKATNEELRHLADAHKPEVDRAINARNAADRRVKNQLRVIRDLLEERKDGLANTPSYKPSLLLEDVRSPKDLGLQSTTSSPITEVRRGKQPERSLNPNRSNGASSSNTSTVRPRTREISQSTPGPSSHRSPGLLSLISSPQISVRSMRGNSGGALGAITQIRVTSPSSSGWQSDPSLDTTVHVPPEQDDAVWKLSASRPPVSAEVLSLPMSWVELQTRLDLDDDTMSSLERCVNTHRRYWKSAVYPTASV
ncbi:hypothetical protein BV22DRAFT_4531 [Leucogyrophana mollusca]|uniref:Uncharacterized protein n=1 Tax=Leucogyrophana mollusca TaxID=85980 RepID=A0ACB8C0Y5_9AGAM|nr:hypothetical protein BV22DRAFT_4531 [Leucogyrophana mollusca]